MESKESSWAQREPCSSSIRKYRSSLTTVCGKGLHPLPQAGLRRWYKGLRCPPLYLSFFNYISDVKLYSLISSFTKCVCVSTCVFACVEAHVCVYMCGITCVYAHACVFACVEARVCARTGVEVCVYMCIHVCECTCMEVHVCMHVHMCLHA